MLLVTGTAGFIGFSVARRLLREGHPLVGIDRVTAPYGLCDVADAVLKEARLRCLREEAVKQGVLFDESRLDLTNQTALREVFLRWRPHSVIHLAAQTGVRASSTHPEAYVQSNLVGFAYLLEECRRHGVAHLSYASTSSVYGANGCLPFSEHHGTNHPLSLYAATKRANELMAHSYAARHQLPCTALRFFTVYGPWGRPDMALFKFTRALFEGHPVTLYGGGESLRDFTYIEDVVTALLEIHAHPASASSTWDSALPSPDPQCSGAGPHRIYNIGRGISISLREMLTLLEAEVGRQACWQNLPFCAEDMRKTSADMHRFREKFSSPPATSLRDGIAAFVAWYRDHRHLAEV